MKYSPRMTVSVNLWRAWEWLDSISEWWAHVTVAPDASKIAVFNSGIEKGLKGWMPAGGQVRPSSTAGASLLWKKAQKNEKKNRTSEVINRIIPQRSPTTTRFVWRPW